MSASDSCTFKSAVRGVQPRWGSAAACPKVHVPVGGPVWQVFIPHIREIVDVTHVIQLLQPLLSGRALLHFVGIHVEPLDGRRRCIGRRWRRLRSIARRPRGWRRGPKVGHADGDHGLPCLAALLGRSRLHLQLPRARHLRCAHVLRVTRRLVLGRARLVVLVLARAVLFLLVLTLLILLARLAMLLAPVVVIRILRIAVVVTALLLAVVTITLVPPALALVLPTAPPVVFAVAITVAIIVVVVVVGLAAHPIAHTAQDEDADDAQGAGHHQRQDRDDHVVLEGTQVAAVARAERVLGAALDALVLRDRRDEARAHVEIRARGPLLDLVEPLLPHAKFDHHEEEDEEADAARQAAAALAPTRLDDREAAHGVEDEDVAEHPTVHEARRHAAGAPQIVVSDVRGAVKREVGVLRVVEARLVVGALLLEVVVRRVRPAVAVAPEVHRAQRVHLAAGAQIEAAQHRHEHRRRKERHEAAHVGRRLVALALAAASPVAHTRPRALAAAGDEPRDADRGEDQPADGGRRDAAAAPLPVVVAARRRGRCCTPPPGAA